MSRFEKSFSFRDELEHWDAVRHLETTARLYEMSGTQGKSRSFVQAGDLMYERFVQYSHTVYERASELQDAEALFNLGWMSSRGRWG